MQIGVLAAAGWSHESIFDLTWAQIEVYARAVRRSNLDDLNLLLSPLLASKGIRKWKGYRIEGDRDTSTVSATQDPAAAEQALAAFGFSVGTEGPQGGG